MNNKAIDYKSKYKNGLDLIKNYGIVTQEQAVRLLGCHYRMLLPLVTSGVLKLVKISRCNFYCVGSTDYTNRQIRRSILLTEFYLNKRENFILDINKKIDKSLIQKNVLFLCHTPARNVNHYLILGVSGDRVYTDRKDYIYLVNLVKEIYFKDDLNRVKIYFYHGYSNFDYDKFLQYLKNDKEIGCIDMLTDSILILKNVPVDIPALRYI